MDHDDYRCDDSYFLNKLSLFVNSALPIATTNKQGQFLYVNACFCSLVKRNKADLLACTDLSLTCPCDINIERENRKKLNAAKPSYCLNRRFIVNTKIKWVKTFVSLITDEKVKEAYYLIVAIDITAEIDNYNHLEISEKKLKRLIEYDDLTCLKSRRAMQIEINEAFLNYQAKQKQSVLVFLDVNDFKNINDTYGHILGDAVLKAIGHHLKQNVRDSDHAGRIGGDEFALLLACSNNLDLSQMLERLSCPVVVMHATIKLNITLSLGAYIIDDKIASSEAWLHAADKAMYQYKKSKNM